MAEKEQAVNPGQGVEADAGEPEILVDQQHDQPDSYNDALLQQERPLANLQYRRHEGVCLGASAL